MSLSKDTKAIIGVLVAVLLVATAMSLYGHISILNDRIDDQRRATSRQFDELQRRVDRLEGRLYSAQRQERTQP